MNCKNCGAPLSQGSEFCTACGMRAAHTFSEKRGASYMPILITLVCVVVVLLAGTVYLIATRNAGEAPVTKEPPGVTEPVFGAPVFPWTSASSVTAPTSAGRRYGPELCIDGQPDTAWNFTGSSGQWIMLSAPTEQRVTGLKILNGYVKYSTDYNGWLYYMNNRPQSISIQFSDGHEISHTLNDAFSPNSYTYQDIRFSQPIITTSLKITINSVYRGSKWNDTAISEIQVY